MTRRKPKENRQGQGDVWATDCPHLRAYNCGIVWYCRKCQKNLAYNAKDFSHGAKNFVENVDFLHQIAYTDDGGDEPHQMFAATRYAA